MGPLGVWISKVCPIHDRFQWVIWARQGGTCSAHTMAIAMRPTSTVSLKTFRSAPNVTPIAATGISTRRRSPNRWPVLCDKVSLFDWDEGGDSVLKSTGLMSISATAGLRQGPRFLREPAAASSRRHGCRPQCRFVEPWLIRGHGVAFLESRRGTTAMVSERIYSIRARGKGFFSRHMHASACPLGAAAGPRGLPVGLGLTPTP